MWEGRNKGFMCSSTVVQMHLRLQTNTGSHTVDQLIMAYQVISNSQQPKTSIFEFK